MPNGSSFQFQAHGIQTWEGRYARIQGDSSVFKVVRRGSKHVVQAHIQTFEGRIICEAVPSTEVKKMIEAINMVKSRHNSQKGGSFLINEYGQVLVPTLEDGRFYVGQTTGVLPFLNLDTYEIVDLSDNSGLETGDPWDLPYVGMIYNLNQRSQFYYWDAPNGSSLKPKSQDQDLIKKIRRIRRNGAVRLLVNPYGLVLTKVPVGDFDPDEDRWDPIYVGRIDYTKWFPKEDVQCQTSS